jgi:2-dehydropantoate 2-reductase
MPLDQAAGVFSGIMRGLSKEPLYGSILQSIMRDRPSEIDYINGEIVRLGKEKKISTPLNEKIVQMVKNVEKTKKFLTIEEIISGTAN